MRARNGPKKFKLMCAPDWLGKIRCKMVKVEKRGKRGWNHLKRGRIKRKPKAPRKFNSDSQHQSQPIQPNKQGNQHGRTASLKDNDINKPSPIVRTSQKTKEIREPATVQRFRVGEEGKILSVKGAQIFIYPPQKKTKKESSSRLLII